MKMVAFVQCSNRLRDSDESATMFRHKAPVFKTGLPPCAEQWNHRYSIYPGSLFEDNTLTILDCGSSHRFPTVSTNRPQTLSRM